MPLPEFLSLSEVAFIHNLDQYKDDLEVYFLQHWTVDKFFALRKQNVICFNNLKFIIMLSDGLDYGKLNSYSNPRILMSFRKRRSDNLGFVLVSIDKKGW